jgi:dipeptidyl aminopeptidase/acylaminoacyl peptidase
LKVLIAKTDVFERYLIEEFYDDYREGSLDRGAFTRRVAFIRGSMAAVSSNVRRLTSDPGADLHGTWSPDGTRIAFGSDRDGDYDIYVMDADGGNVRQLTDHPAKDSSPAWSPAP